MANFTKQIHVRCTSAEFAIAEALGARWRTSPAGALRILLRQEGAELAGPAVDAPAPPATPTTWTSSLMPPERPSPAAVAPLPAQEGPANASAAPPPHTATLAPLDASAGALDVQAEAPPPPEVGPIEAAPAPPPPLAPTLPQDAPPLAPPLAAPSPPPEPAPPLLDGRVANSVAPDAGHRIVSDPLDSQPRMAYCISHRGDESPTEVTNMSQIEITLSSANMGDVDEVDFDCWASFVCDNIDQAIGAGVVYSVEQARFGEAGEDVISGATDEQRETIRRWLSVDGWEAFCAGAWNTLRAAREKAN